jgi:hypothetical protein
MHRSESSVDPKASCRAFRNRLLAFCKPDSKEQSHSHIETNKFLIMSLKSYLQIVCLSLQPLSSDRDPWQAPPLRTPIPIAGIAYAQSQQEIASFPEANRDRSYLQRNYLTLDELKECFPAGSITHQEWRHGDNDKIYRCAEAEPRVDTVRMVLMLHTLQLQSSGVLMPALWLPVAGQAATPPARCTLHTQCVPQQAPSRLPLHTLVRLHKVHLQSS